MIEWIPMEGSSRLGIGDSENHQSVNEEMVYLNL